MTDQDRTAQAEDDDDRLADAYNRGLDLERAGNLDEAAAAYREALTLDPADHGGVTVRLAAMGHGAVPERAPDAYVATLFDQNAAVFDDMLVEQLGYSVPMLVRERLDALFDRTFERLLDLGCGTGLTATSLTGRFHSATGVDLSENMLDEAHERGVYETLFIAEACAFLEAEPDHAWDLITATDVLPYLGALEVFVANAARALAPDGVLVVSTENGPCPELAERGWGLGAKHRYAHANAYVQALAKAAGLSAAETLDIIVRYDDGEPVPGSLMVFSRPDRSAR